MVDAPGEEKVTPIEPEPTWHPSFRYFRLAQVSDEVFDAYRNLFLALESILSTAMPPEKHEREFDWIARALTAAAEAGVPLATNAPAGARDPVPAIRHDLYSDVRTATFHAKASGITLLPLDPVDRGAVLDSLSRLAGLYLELVSVTLGVRRRSGAFFRAGFDLMFGDPFAESVVHVTDDEAPVDASSTSVNPSGGRVKVIATRPFSEYDRPFLRTIIGEASVDELRELTHIGRIAAVHRDGTPFTGGQLEARLTLGGVDTFQALMGMRGLNVRLPRMFYAA